MALGMLGAIFQFYQPCKPVPCTCLSLQPRFSVLVCQVSLKERVVGCGAPLRGSSASPAGSISLCEPLRATLMVGPTTTRFNPCLAIATASSDVDGKSIATVLTFGMSPPTGWV